MLTGISPDSLGPCRSGKDLGFKDVGEPLKEKKDEVTVTHVVVATPAGKRLIKWPCNECLQGPQSTPLLQLSSQRLQVSLEQSQFEVGAENCTGIESGALNASGLPMGYLFRSGLWISDS